MPDARALQRRASAELARGELGLAAHTLVEAIEVAPREPALYEALIQVTLLGGSTQTAVQAAKELRALEPEKARPLYLLGVALLAQGEAAEAGVALREAQARAPDSAEVAQALAQVAALEAQRAGPR